MKSLFPRRHLGVAFVLSCVGVIPVTAQSPPPRMDDVSPGALQDDRTYAVSSIKLQYRPSFQVVGDRPTPESLLESVRVDLSRGSGGWVGPTGLGEQLNPRLSELAETRLSLDAIDAIANAVAAQFPLSGIYVVADPAHIDPRTGEDRRPGARGPLQFLLEYDGPFIGISRFELAYALADRPGLPPLNRVYDDVEVTFHRTDQGYVGWRPAGQPFRLNLADLQEQLTIDLSLSAVQAVLLAVNRYFVDHEFMGIHVVPAPGQLEGDRDVRSGATDFKIHIVTGLVTDVRTLGVGERVPAETRVNNPVHHRILDRSPFQPGGGLDGGSLLNRELLDNYLFRLSRHPGRRVDASLGPSDDLYGMTLDYQVSEKKPLTLYAQISNTGTRQTDRLRERFGLFHNQLTGNDDVLTLEYITANFENTHAVLGSYEAPFGTNDRLRWRVYGSWSQYQASDVGFAGEEFRGKSWTGGAELLWNVHQDRQLFVDLIGGARFFNPQVTNRVVDTQGEEDFIIPYGGLRLQRYTEEASTDVTLTVQVNPDLLDSDPIELNNLGRLASDDDWVALRWDASQSLFLEPLFAPEAVARGDFTLAHELSFRFRGQYAFDYRLIPQEEQVAGGLYSVRGYPESVSVGDTVLLGTIEYRYHLPYGKYERDPQELFGQPFRFHPQYPYGRADWDLVFKAFFDVGYTVNSERLSFERDDTLLGVGIGADLLFRQNLTVRVDWGFALKDIPGEVNSESNRLHFVATILY